MTFDERSTVGATSRGSVAMGTASFQALDTRAASLRYRFDDGDWRVKGPARVRRPPTEVSGHQARARFRQLGVAMAFPVRVTLADVDEIQPHRIEVSATPTSG